MLLKIPGFVKIQTVPYNHLTYNSEIERTLFHHAPAIIRWRYKRNKNNEILFDNKGKPIRESNARLVKWSDGSYQFIIGDESFEGQLVTSNDRFAYLSNIS